MAQAAEMLRFRVHARNIDAHHARVLEERSFEAAAVAYLEDLHGVGDAHEISIIVRELDTSHEHYFRIDLDRGKAAPCD